MVIGAMELAGRNWAGFVVFEVIMCGLLIGVCYARGEAAMALGEVTGLA